VIARLRSRRRAAGPGQAGGSAGAGDPAGSDYELHGGAQPDDIPAGDVPPGVRARRRHDPWRVAFFAVLVVAVLVGGGAWALLGSSLLVVRHEKVTGNRLVSVSEVLAAARIRYGTPLISVNTPAATQRIERIDQVLSATVSRSWPDTIVISIRERTPLLAVPVSGAYALVDASGVIVRWSQRRPRGMAVLQVPPAQLRGDPAVLAAAAVLRELPGGLRRRVLSISASSAQSVTLSVRGAITIVWGGPGAGQLKAREITTLLRTGAHYYDVSDPATAVTQG
jgi:cell division protein FtsQ